MQSDSGQIISESTKINLFNYCIPKLKMMRDNQNKEGVVNMLLIMMYVVEDLESYKSLEFKKLYDFCVNNSFTWLTSLKEKTMAWYAISQVAVINTKESNEILKMSVS